ncbi:MAG: hypothetical protein FJ125_14545 [Deltaproteobacteria bacterium]|nr:hypothetical protein [Deltaproteobacteria bacterium]
MIRAGCRGVLLGGWLLLQPGTAGAGPLGQLEQLQQQLEQQAFEEQDQAERLAELDRLLTRATVGLERKAEEMDAKRSRLRRRLLALDRLGRTGRLSLLMLASSLRDLHRREQMLLQALRGERELLGQTARADRELRAARDEAERVRDELEALLVRRQSGRLQQEQRRGSRQQLLDRIRDDERLAETAAQEIRVGAAELRRLLESRARNGDRWPPLAGRRGRLPLPVEGKLLLNFGALRPPLEKAGVRHTGVDLLAAAGSIVKSVHQGEVVFTGALPGYGKLVAVAHGRGYHSVYAQLKRIEVAEGTAVEDGTALGEVGYDPLDEQTLLHFEVRSRGQVEDPREWFGR